jgi:hypothetical protein
MKILLLVAELVLYRVFSQLAVGIIVNLTQTVIGVGDGISFPLDAKTFPIVLRMWFQGATVLEISTIFVLLQPIGTRFARFFSLNDLIVWVFDCKLICSKLNLVLTSDTMSMEVVEDHLDILQETMVLPVFQLFAVNGVNTIIFCAWLISLITHQHIGKSLIVFMSLLWMILTALKLSWNTLKTFTTVAYQKLFDENYLVGRQLLNFL